MNEVNPNQQLLHIVLGANELRIPFQPTGGLSQQHLKAIYNAWQGCAVIDLKGTVWIAKDRIHTILRTHKQNANYLLRAVKDTNKCVIGKQTYIRGTEICQLLDATIQSAGKMKKEDYLRFSEERYKELRDAPEVKNLRAAHYELTADLRRRLKKARQKKLRIETDELTGKPLRIHSDFSHIRSVASYFELSSYHWNGLLVNKETHQLITEHNIHDEEALKTLCVAQAWKTGWYKGYKQALRGIGIENLSKNFTTFNILSISNEFSFTNKGFSVKIVCYLSTNV